MTQPAASGSGPGIDPIANLSIQADEAAQVADAIKKGRYVTIETTASRRVIHEFEWGIKALWHQIWADNPLETYWSTDSQKNYLLAKEKNLTQLAETGNVPTPVHSITVMTSPKMGNAQQMGKPQSEQPPTLAELAEAAITNCRHFSKEVEPRKIAAAEIKEKLKPFQTISPQATIEECQALLTSVTTNKNKLSPTMLAQVQELLQLNLEKLAKGQGTVLADFQAQAKQAIAGNNFEAQMKLHDNNKEDAHGAALKKFASDFKAAFTNVENIKTDDIQSVMTELEENQKSRGEQLSALRNNMVQKNLLPVVRRMNIRVSQQTLKDPYASSQSPYASHKENLTILQTSMESFVRNKGSAEDFTAILQSHEKLTGEVRLSLAESANAAVAPKLKVLKEVPKDAILSQKGKALGELNAVMKEHVDGLMNPLLTQCNQTIAKLGKQIQSEVHAIVLGQIGHLEKAAKQGSAFMEECDDLVQSMQLYKGVMSEEVEAKARAALTNLYDALGSQFDRYSQAFTENARNTNLNVKTRTYLDQDDQYEKFKAQFDKVWSERFKSIDSVLETDSSKQLLPRVASAGEALKNLRQNILKEWKTRLEFLIGKTDRPNELTGLLEKIDQFPKESDPGLALHTIINNISHFFRPPDPKK